MVIYRYIQFVFIGLLTMSIQVVHAANDYKLINGWMSMDLSQSLASKHSKFILAKQIYLLQEFAVHDNTAASITNDTRYTTSLLLDHNNQNISSQQQAWIKHDQELISNIPALTTNLLLAKSQQLITTLDMKKIAMDKNVQGTAFDTKDALISIIVPGGLLYASYRKQAHNQANEQLKQITNERDELAKDILMLKSISKSRLAVAIAD